MSTNTLIQDQESGTPQWCGVAFLVTAALFHFPDCPLQPNTVLHPKQYVLCKYWMCTSSDVCAKPF